jgi:hypothetical protein
MSETRKIAAILCADVVGYSRLAGADEDRILLYFQRLFWIGPVLGNLSKAKSPRVTPRGRVEDDARSVDERRGPSSDG